MAVSMMSTLNAMAPLGYLLLSATLFGSLGTMASPNGYPSCEGYTEGPKWLYNIKCTRPNPNG